MDDQQHGAGDPASAFDAGIDPATRCSRPANFPGASTAQLTDARDLYGCSTGRVTSISGQAALDDGTDQYVYLGTRRRRGGMNEYSAVRAGLVAPDADADAQRRPALGRADAVHAGERHHVARVTCADLCGMSGMGDERADAATSSTPARTAASVPSSSQFTQAATLGYNTDWNNSRRTSASRGGRTCRAACCGRCSAIPSRRRCAPATRWPTTARAWASSPAIYGANPGSTLSRDPQRSDRQSGRRRASRGRSSAARPGRLWHRAVPGDGRRIRSRRRPSRADSINMFASGHPGRVRAHLDRRLAARDRRATWRSTSATSARAA